MAQTVIQPDDIVCVRWQFAYGPDPTNHQEICEFRVNGLAGPGPSTDLDWIQYLKDLAFSSYTAWSGQQDATQFSGVATLQSVMTTRFDTLGRTKAEAVHVQTEIWQGSGTGGCLPWQLSPCVGLYTYTPGSFVNDARSRRGRIYLPVPTADSLGGGLGLLTTAHALAYASHTKAMLVECNLMDGSTNPAWRWNAGILSKGPYKDGRLEGSFATLTDVTCDTKLDTQRRRTNREVGARQVVSFS